MHNILYADDKTCLFAFWSYCTLANLPVILGNLLYNTSPKDEDADGFTALPQSAIHEWVASHV